MVIRPHRAKLAFRAEKQFTAYAIDRLGQMVAAPVSWHWTMEGLTDCSIAARGGEAFLTAGAAEATGRVIARARAADGSEREGAAEVRISALAGAGRDAGIPQPRFIAAATEDWHSRMQGGVWEVNSSHPDFRATEVERVRRVRYLAALYAKEMVLATYNQPQAEPILERLVEVLTAVDLSLSRAVVRRKERG